MNIALISARGGSKGLPRKNVLQLGGKPLVAWTIEAALDAKNIDLVLVSTEDEEIASTSTKFGAQIIQRPVALAQDDSTSEDVVTHALSHFQHSGLSPDSIALLQPTSPFRTATHIDEAYAVFERKDANLVLSVFEPSFCLAKAYQLNQDGTISGMFSPNSPYSRRQDLPAGYIPNGAIYLINCRSYLQGTCIPKNRVYPYLMSQDDSLDIDSKEDLLAAESIIGRKNE